MANRLDNSSKPPEEPAAPKTETPAPPKAGGKPWLPLVLNIVLMPAIAYGMTVFMLIPKIQGDKKVDAHAEEAPAVDAHGAPSAAKAGTVTKGKVTVPLGGKVLVNVAGTAGTRYLVVNMSLVGKAPELKLQVEGNDPQLRDAAMSILGGKTITDLEKPGMRNIIRAELISAFNDIVGKEAVSDIYFTEFAIQ